jgi:hypothetical protein
MQQIPRVDSIESASGTGEGRACRTQKSSFPNPVGPSEAVAARLAPGRAQEARASALPHSCLPPTVFAGRRRDWSSRSAFLFFPPSQLALGVLGFPTCGAVQQNALHINSPVLQIHTYTLLSAHSLLLLDLYARSHDNRGRRTV